MTLDPVKLRALLRQGLTDDVARLAAADYLGEHGHDDLAAALRDPALVGVWQPAPAREPTFVFVTDAGITKDLIAPYDAGDDLCTLWVYDADRVVYGARVHDGKRSAAWWFREPFAIPADEEGLWGARVCDGESALDYLVVGGPKHDGRNEVYIFDPETASMIEWDE
jgi:hypothetical protein